MILQQLQWRRKKVSTFYVIDDLKEASVFVTHPSLLFFDKSTTTPLYRYHLKQYILDKAKSTNTLAHFVWTWVEIWKRFKISILGQQPNPGRRQHVRPEIFQTRLQYFEAWIS